MRAEKRVITDSEDEERKRAKKQWTPDAASVFMPDLLMNLLHHPSFIKIMQEVVENYFKNLGLPMPGRLPEKQPHESDGRKLQLHFMTCLPEKLFTKQKLQGKQGGDIQIKLMDANTGSVVSSGPESSLHLEIVVVGGDFDDLPHADWTREQFEGHIVKERVGKGPIVSGQLKVALNKGVTALGEITFTDNSRWARGQKFRLGVRSIAGQSFGIRVREAKSEAFSVKENRGEYYEKHDPPNSKDEVWRLMGIGRNGPYHKALTKESISTVEDFVRQLVMNPELLRNIFGSNSRKWDRLAEHARRCTSSKKIYAYYDDEAKKAIVFNNVYEVIGLLVNDNYIPTESLPGPEKAYLDYIKRKAYGDCRNFKEHDEEELLRHDRRERTIEPNPVTLETCLPVRQHVEELSTPSIPMEHTEGIPDLMLQHQAQQNVQLEPSLAAASGSNPTASTAPTDPSLFSEHASCSLFTVKAQVGNFGSCLPVHHFGQHDFHHVHPPTLGPCFPAVHNAGQHVEELSNPSMPREHNKLIPASMPEQQVAQDSQLGQSSALDSSSHPTASTAPNETQVGISGSLGDGQPSFGNPDSAELLRLLFDDEFFSDDTLQETNANARFQFWSLVYQGWLKP